MASTYNCSQCGKTGYPPGGQVYDQTPKGWVYNKSIGFGKKLFCSNKCLNEFNAQNSDKNQGSNNTVASPNNGESRANAERSRAQAAEARAEEANARAEKARIDLERERHEDEMDLKRKQQELVEKKERQKRADELRGRGKNFQAFIVEFQNAIIGTSVVLGLALFIFFFIQNENRNKADAMKLNSELELIEDSVKIYINEKKFDRALILTNKLVHESHTQMKHIKLTGFLGGHPYYDEYWNEKREYYKQIILNKGTLDSENSFENDSNEPSKQEKNLSNEIENSDMESSEIDFQEEYQEEEYYQE
jgi:hypothetical protein